MLLKNFIVLMLITFACVVLFTDSFLVDDDGYIDPRREQLLKNIPMIIKRSYVRWNRKNTCNDRVLRSTRASVRSMESEWFSFSIRMPRLMTPLLKSQILLEFHKVENISQAHECNYTIAVKPFNSKIKPRYIRLKKLIAENDLAELFFNITPIHFRLMSDGNRYMRLRYRLFVSCGDDTTMIATMPFQHKTMKAYLITLEENKNCTLDVVSMNAQKLLELSKRKSMLKTMETLSVPLYPSKDSPYYTCRLTNWYVPFSEIGWSSFVIAPSAINAKACTGSCDFPLMTNTSQHALLQTAVSNTMGSKTSVCCVPLTTDQTTLIIYDDELESVFIIKVENIIASSCGCR